MREADLGKKKAGEFPVSHSTLKYPTNNPTLQLFEEHSWETQPRESPSLCLSCLTWLCIKEKADRRVWHSAVGQQFTHSVIRACNKYAIGQST